MHKQKSQRIYTSMHSAGLELTKLTYTRLEDNLIRHRGDRLKLQQYDGYVRIPMLLSAATLLRTHNSVLALRFDRVVTSRQGRENQP